MDGVSNFISLRGIKKIYGGNGTEPVYALRGVDLDIEDWDFTAIMGASGGGKSTLMNIVGLLDVPSEWKYFLRGKEVKDLTDDQQAMIRRTTIGFIFQGYNLLKRMTAREQVALPLSYMGISGQEAKEKAYHALKLVGLEGREQALPNQLFKTLNKEQKKTILLITHDANVASYADKVYKIRDGAFVE